MCQASMRELINTSELMREAGKLADGKAVGPG
jgi:hypothetical protein